MAGNYLSVIMLFDAWQDAGGEAATAPLIRLTSAGLQGEEKRGESAELQKETGKTGREGKGSKEEGG